MYNIPHQCACLEANIHVTVSRLLVRFCNSDSNITIGFAQPSYTIREDGGNISVCLNVDVVQLLTGVITVQIMTVDITATGKTNHQCTFSPYANRIHNILLTAMEDFMLVSRNLTVNFTEGVPNQEFITIPIPVFDDDVVETAERFRVDIIPYDLEEVYVTIQSTTVHITDCSGSDNELLDSKQLLFITFFLVMQLYTSGL